MRYLVNFSLFEEVNPRDIAFIESELNNYFTVAFEFEIETLDKGNLKYKYKDLDEETIEDVLETVTKDFKIRKKSEKELIFNLAYSLYDEVESKNVNENTFDRIFDISKYTDE